MPALYIVLSKKIPGVDATGLEGRALSKYSEELKSLAEQAGVKALMSFFSVNREEALSLLDGYEGNVYVPDETWFPPTEGLRTISALLDTLSQASSLPRSAVEKELREFQAVLEAAETANVRWHLAIDY